MDILEKVKMLADAKNMSISDIEKLAGVSNGSIGKWVNSIPKADNLFKVAQVLEHSVEYFLTDDYYSYNSSFSDEEKELLETYNKLDKRGRHKLHTIAYEELDRMNDVAPKPKNKESHAG